MLRTYIYLPVCLGKRWRKQAEKTYGRYPELSLAEARRVHGEFKSGS